MLDFDFSKLMVIGVVALIFIPAKDLPRALRQLGLLIGKVRRMATEFQGHFMDAMKDADVASVKKDIEDATHFDVSFDPANDIRKQMTSTMEGLSKSVDDLSASPQATPLSNPHESSSDHESFMRPAVSEPGVHEQSLSSDDAFWPPEETAIVASDIAAQEPPPALPEVSPAVLPPAVLPKMPAMAEAHAAVEPPAKLASSKSL